MMKRYWSLRAYAFAGALLVIGVGGQLASTSGFTCCKNEAAGSYAAQADSGSTFSSPDVSTNPGSSYDTNVQTYTGTRTSSSAVITLRVYDNIPANTDSDTAGGNGSGSRNQSWQWSGPAGTAPGALYSVSFQGSGSVQTNGTCTVGTWGIGTYATSSASGSSNGSGSGSGASHPNTSVQNVGGQANYNTTGSVTGQANQEGGASATVSAGTTGTGSYAQTGSWTININSTGGLDCGGTTITVSTSHQSVASASGTANGSLAGPASSYGTVNAQASMNATVSNVRRCDTQQ